LDVPGFHQEVQRLALYVKDHAKPSDEVIEYQMGHRNGTDAAGYRRIQETAHPSTLMLMDRDALMLDDWSSVLREPGPAWILTRWNRLGPGDLAAAGGRLRQISTSMPQDLYRLYYLSSSGRQ
jgi:hypothetical protein